MVSLRDVRAALPEASIPSVVLGPAEAIEWQQEHSGEVRTIPVYLEDGVTQIGEFETG